jgi:hypothetical protein
MTDKEIENLYWATAQRYSPMANHVSVIVAFARLIEKATKQEPYLNWPTLDPIDQVEGSKCS